MTIEDLLRQELKPVNPTTEQAQAMDSAISRLLLTIKLARANAAGAEGCAQNCAPYSQRQHNERGKSVPVCRYFTQFMVESHHEAGFEAKPCRYLGKLGTFFAHQRVEEHFQCTYGFQDARHRKQRS